MAVWLVGSLLELGTALYADFCVCGCGVVLNVASFPIVVRILHSTIGHVHTNGYQIISDSGQGSSQATVLFISLYRAYGGARYGRTATRTWRAGTILPPLVDRRRTKILCLGGVGLGRIGLAASAACSLVSFAYGALPTIW